MTIEKFFIVFASIAFLGMLSWGVSIHFSRKKRVVNYSPNEEVRSFGFSMEPNLPSVESSFSGPSTDSGPTTDPTGPQMSNHALRNNAMRGKGIVQSSGPDSGPTGPTGPSK